MKKTNKRGISLIVLVITIIVMIILASAIILSLSNSGIIGKANQAKKASDLANARDLVTLAYADWELDEGLHSTYGGAFKVYAETKLNEAGYETGKTEGALEVTETGKIYVYPKIPEGFSASTISTEDDVSEGLVVKDSLGNEFVWIPVDMERTPMFTKGEDGNYTAVLYDGNGNKITGNREPVSTSAFDQIPQFYNLILEPEYRDMSPALLVGIRAQFQDEYNSMAKSVEKYGGFYVGRYETSWTGTKVASVPGVMPMNGDLPFEDLSAEPNQYDWEQDNAKDGKGATWYTFYGKQKELYTRDSNSSVVSGMIYGSQWDAIMNWMLDGTEDEIRYVTDSTDMGWHSILLEDGTTKQEVPGNPDHLTGLDLNGGKNKVKNIYDMAGNLWEWTQESGDGVHNRINRGGHYGRTALEKSASDKSDDMPVCSAARGTSRLQLYIK